MIVDVKPPMKDVILENVYEAITKKINAVREEIIKEAVTSFEKRVREVVGNTVIDAAHFYNVTTIGSELVIRIQIDADRR